MHSFPKWKIIKVSVLGTYNLFCLNVEKTRKFDLTCWMRGMRLAIHSWNISTMWNSFEFLGLVIAHSYPSVMDQSIVSKMEHASSDWIGVNIWLPWLHNWRMKKSGRHRQGEIKVIKQSGISQLSRVYEGRPSLGNLTINIFGFAFSSWLISAIFTFWWVCLYAIFIPSIR